MPLHYGDKVLIKLVTDEDGSTGYSFSECALEKEYIWVDTINTPNKEHTNIVFELLPPEGKYKGDNVDTNILVEFDAYKADKITFLGKVSVDTDIVTTDISASTNYLVYHHNGVERSKFKIEVEGDSTQESIQELKKFKLTHNGNYVFNGPPLDCGNPMITQTAIEGNYQVFTLLTFDRVEEYTPTENNNSGLSNAAIIGLSVGAFIVVVGIAILLWMTYMRGCFSNDHIYVTKVSLQDEMTEMTKVKNSIHKSK